MTGARSYASKADASIGVDRFLIRIDPVQEDVSGIPGAREIISVDTSREETSEERRLYVEIPYGRGAVGIFTIDDQTYRDQESAAFLQALWLPVVKWRLDRRRSDIESTRVRSSSRSASRTPILRHVPIPVRI